MEESSDELSATGRSLLNKSSHINININRGSYALAELGGPLFRNALYQLRLRPHWKHEHWLSDYPPYWFLKSLFWGETQASPTVMCWLNFLSLYIYIDRPTAVCETTPDVTGYDAVGKIFASKLCVMRTSRSNDTVRVASHSSWNSSLIELVEV